MSLGAIIDNNELIIIKSYQVCVVCLCNWPAVVN